MLRRWLLGGLTVGLMASVLFAKPGVVVNKQGETFKGDVTEDDKYVYIDSVGGQLKLDKRNIDKIQYDISVDDEYNSRHAKLAANDVKGRIDLANWANEKQRVDLAIAALQEARQIDPTNRDAALALDAAQRQLDLDQAAKGKKPVPATAPDATAVPAPGAPAVTKAPPLEHRMLNADEINIIRQKEMSVDDAKLRVRFDNAVVKHYLASGDRDAAAFNALTPAAQANEILTNGDPKMAKDVRILTDPAPLLEFKLKVQPILSMGCASSACHGGTKGGTFALYSGDSTTATYSNFFILQTYSKTIDKVKYLALDREVPDHSLALQFGLPPAIGTPPHPHTPDWKARFRTTNDPAYQEIYTWLSALHLPQPDYGIKVAPGVPATQPDADAPAK